MFLSGFGLGERKKKKLPLHLVRGTKDPARHPRALHGLRSDEEGWPRDPGRAWAETALSFGAIATFPDLLL